MTTTAVSYPRDSSVPDVCIVRVLISQYLFPDVNLDRVIDQLDLNLVEASPYFTLGNVSLCPFNTTTQVRDCGRADVNQDGIVDINDRTSITQSSFLGTDVSCGAVYSTMFSCGSSRQAPLTPALAISLDSIVYFDQTGLDGVETPYAIAKRSLRARMESLDRQILVELEGLKDHDARMEFDLDAEDLALHSLDRMASNSEAETSSKKSFVTEVAVSLGAVVLSGLVAIFVFKTKNN